MSQSTPTKIPSTVPGKKEGKKKEGGEIWRIIFASLTFPMFSQGTTRYYITALFCFLFLFFSLYGKMWNKISNGDRCTKPKMWVSLPSNAAAWWCECTWGVSHMESHLHCPFSSLAARAAMHTGSRQPGSHAHRQHEPHGHSSTFCNRPWAGYCSDADTCKGKLYIPYARHRRRHLGRGPLFSVSWGDNSMLWVT